MTRRRDTSADLRRANPVREADVPSPDSPKARALMERIVRTEPEATQSVPTRRRTRRRAFLVLVPVAILVLGAAGFSIYRSADEPLVIACHATMARHGTTVMASGPGDPVAACTGLWRPGGALNPRAELSLPLLEACIQDGAAHVFPHPDGVDACEKLGLKHAAAPSRRQADEAAAADHAKTDLADESVTKCDTRAQGIAFARRVLRKEGLSGWAVRVVGRPFTPSAPCAAADVDLQRRTIWISSVSRTT
jgi:hypothetical protein